MKAYLKWFLINGGILTAFIYGIMCSQPSLTVLAVVIYWFTSILAIVFYIFLTFDKNSVLLKHATKPSAILKPLDVAYDVLVVYALVYFSYPVLAIFYTLHIFLLWKIRVLLETAYYNNLKTTKD